LADRRLVRRVVTETGMGRRLVDRFVAGDTLEAGIAAARSLHVQGVATMLDHLGENAETADQADAATDAYVRALKRIRDSPDIDCNISVKLTQLGLDISMAQCAENMERVLQAAADEGGATLVMIDMEARPYVDPTLQTYLELRDRYRNIGLCLQAYLRRSDADAHLIAGPGAIVRVAKGAYLEPPEFAHRTRRAVRRSFARIAATLLGKGSIVHVATHDPRLIAGARRFIRARSISNRRYEFQMLYGIRRDLQRILVSQGEPVRVYVPYGTRWYPYLTRRLAERPANVWFFVSNLLARGG
jgi:proline dehydrogenase